MPNYRNFPQSGTTSNLLERLCVFMDSVHSNWSTEVEGANNKEILALESLMGLSEASIRLPLSYRQTLGLLGHNDCGLLASLPGRYGASRTMSDIIENYSDAKFREESELHRPLVLASEIGIYLGFDLRNPSIKEPAIVHEQSEPREIYAPNWETLILRQALRKRDSDLSEYQLWFSSSQSELRGMGRELDDLLRTLESEYMLEKAWLNDETQTYLASKTISIDVDTSIGALVTVSGAREQVQQISDRMALYIGAPPPISLTNR